LVTVPVPVIRRVEPVVPNTTSGFRTMSSDTVSVRSARGSPRNEPAAM
jgi:hypothetical protein